MNSVKSRIKHKCLKTENGTRFYNYMHQLNLQYGQKVREILKVTAFLILTIVFVFVGWALMYGLIMLLQNILISKILAVIFVPIIVIWLLYKLGKYVLRFIAALFF